MIPILIPLMIRFLNDYFSTLEEEIFRNRNEKLVLKSLGIWLQWSLVKLLMLYVIDSQKKKGS